MSTATETIDASAPEVALPIARREATVMELAAVIAGSRDFPECRSPEKAAVRILAGREMGIGPIASVIGIRVQNGRVSMDSSLMAGCIERSPVYAYKVVRIEADGAVLDFYKSGEVVGQSSFTADDAKKAGLAGKDTWRGYPRNMMFARALSNGARWYCSGIFGGAIYTHEELSYAVDEEGRAVAIGDGTTGGDLCTREQRQEIAGLVEQLGGGLPELLAELGVRMLDELSGYEADKLVKKLAKKAAKAGGQASGSGPTKPVPGPEATTTAAPAATTEQLGPGQQILADGFEESRLPSTPQQRQRILDLAEKLEPNEQDCYDMLVAILAKRHLTKMIELNHLQAAALIEAMEGRLAEQPPFDASGAKGTTTEAPRTAPVKIPDRAKGNKPH